MQRCCPAAIVASVAVLLSAGCNVASRSVGADGGAPPARSSPEALSASALPSASAPSPPAASPAAPTTHDAAAEAGGDAEAASPCPQGMTLVNKFCIDVWEASLVAIDADGKESAHPHFERPQAGVVYEARSVPGVFPQGYISRVEAAAACKKADKRLCSRHEWLRACQGKKGFTWPYGWRGQSGKCNNGKVHLLSKLFGTQGRNWKYDEHFNSPALNQEPGFLAKGGEYVGCASAEGVFDLVGNLHEWVSDTVDDSLVEALEKEEVERRSQPHRTGNGVFLGGFFSTTSELGPGCKYITIAHEPTYHDYSTGFRCCKKAVRQQGGAARDVNALPTR